MSEVLTDVVDVLGWVLLVLGSGLSLFASIGLVRFPDLLTRMHAAAKPQVLGLVLVAAGVACVLRDGSATALLVLVVLAQMLTVPVGGHTLARSSHRAGQIDRSLLLVDELSDDPDVEHGSSRHRGSVEPG